MFDFLHKFQSFLEATLNIQELEKPDKSSSKKRGQILVNKLKSKDPIKKKDGKVVTVDKMYVDGDWEEPSDAVDQITTGGEYDQVKGQEYFIKNFTPNMDPKKYKYKNVFKDDDGDEFGLTQIFKSADFGSKGAGVDTGLNEVLQAIFIGIRLESSEDLSVENIRKSYQRYLSESEKSPIVMVDDKYETIDEEKLEKFLSNRDWVETFINVPNLLFSYEKIVDKQFLPLIDPQKLYLVYHTSYKSDKSPYFILKKKYLQLAKLSKFTNKDFSKVNFNKFCPGDVYIFEPDSIENFRADVNNSKDIHELIKICEDYYDEGKSIPVSLKMVKSGGNYRIITNNEIYSKSPLFSIDKFIINDDPYRGIGSKIKTSSIWFYREENVHRDRTINFDSSDTSKYTEIDGEVDGSTSRHGKISLEQIIRIIRKNKQLNKIESVNSLKKLTIEQLEQKLNKLYEELDSKGKNNIQYNLSDRGSKIEGSEKKIISKIQSLQVVKTLLDIHTKDQNTANIIITEIMKFALSIQVDYFLTPYYLRVI
jgi:hypothetical protein